MDVNATDERLPVRVITRVYGQETLVAGGRFERLDEAVQKPSVVVWYPAGRKRFNAITGHDKGHKWRIHPEDLTFIQSRFPRHMRFVRARWSSETNGYRTLFGMRFVPEDAPREKRALVVVLAPTDANHESESRALVRLVNIANEEGWDEVEVVALFSMVPDKDAIALSIGSCTDPVGPDNDQTILDAARRANIVVVAWGSELTFGSRQPPTIRDRDEHVLALLRRAGHETVYAFHEEGCGIPDVPPHPSHVSELYTVRPWKKPLKPPRKPRAPKASK